MAQAVSATPPATKRALADRVRDHGRARRVNTRIRRRQTAGPRAELGGFELFEMPCKPPANRRAMPAQRCCNHVNPHAILEPHPNRRRSRNRIDPWPMRVEPTALYHVSNIVQVCAAPQMPPLATRRVIAPMPDHKLTGLAIMSQCPGNSMRKEGVPLIGDAALNESIARRHLTALPFTTSLRTRRLTDLRQKAIAALADDHRQNCYQRSIRHSSIMRPLSHNRSLGKRHSLISRRLQPMLMYGKRLLASRHKMLISSRQP